MPGGRRGRAFRLRTTNKTKNAFNHSRKTRRETCTQEQLGYFGSHPLFYKETPAAPQNQDVLLTATPGMFEAVIHAVASLRVVDEDCIKELLNIS